MSVLSRERVIDALNFKEPDRVPVDVIVTVDVYRDLCNELGMNIDENIPMSYATVVQMPIDMIIRLGIDAYWVNPRSSKSVHSRRFEDGSFVDEWGIHFKKARLSNGSFYFEAVNRPFGDVEEPTEELIENYEWPDPDDPARYESLIENIAFVRQNSDLAVLCKMANCVFEEGKYFRGFEQWMVDILLYPEFANAFMNKMVDINMRIYTNCIRAVGKDVDVVRLAGEDLGMQDRMLFSAEAYRDMIKPHLKRLFTHVRRELDRVNPGAKLMLHTCGSVYDIIDDLIDTGVEVLDPVQPKAARMDRRLLKEKFGGKIAFHGNIDEQHVLPFGTPEEIRAEVRDAIGVLAPGGGFWLSPSHNVQSDVSAKNLLVMLEAAKEYGRYPIQ
jgi:uroporphyrinogen decarboxylase